MIIRAIMMMRMMVRRVLISAKMRKACAKVAMRRQPMMAPMVMAKKVFQGFMPMSRPMMEATSPPDPWKGTMTKRMMPRNRRGLTQLYFCPVVFPLSSIVMMNRPMRGIFFARS